MNILFNYVLYPERRYRRSKRGLKAWNSKHYDSIVGEGPPGIRDIKQEAQNVDAISIMSRSASKFRKQTDLSLSMEYTKFLDRNP